MTYTAKIRDTIIISEDLSVLSKAYCRIRDESGEGGSTFPPANVRQDGKPIGHISYNGRIWDQPLNRGRSLPLCLDDSKMLYDNRE
jgi:hypothetical protein